MQNYSGRSAMRSSWPGQRNMKQSEVDSARRDADYKLGRMSRKQIRR